MPKSGVSEAAADGGPEMQVVAGAKAGRIECSCRVRSDGRTNDELKLERERSTMKWPRIQTTVFRKDFYSTNRKLLFTHVDHSLSKRGGGAEMVWSDARDSWTAQQSWRRWCRSFRDPRLRWEPERLLV